MRGRSHIVFLPACLWATMMIFFFRCYSQSAPFLGPSSYQHQALAMPGLSSTQIHLGKIHRSCGSTQLAGTIHKISVGTKKCSSFSTERLPPGKGATFRDEFRTSTDVSCPLKPTQGLGASVLSVKQSKVVPPNC